MLLAEISTFKFPWGLRQFTIEMFFLYLELIFRGTYSIFISAFPWEGISSLAGLQLTTCRKAEKNSE